MIRIMESKKTSGDPMALQLTRLGFKIFTPFLPDLMNEYAYDLWVTPTHVKTPERELAFANKAKASYILVEGLRIRVWSWGEGPTVLFIHGWGGRGTQIYSYIEQFNKAGFKVVSFDMPAHGESDGKQTNAFNVTRATQEVLKQIDNLHTIITHSFGAIILGYLYNAQLPLKSLVMLCPPSTLNMALDQFSASLHLTEDTKHYIAEKLKKNFGNDVFERLSLIKNIQKMNQPVLVVHDKQDSIVPYEAGMAIAKAAKRGTFCGTNELGHRKILHDNKVIENIIDFISMV